jgi:hypothetical protein
MKISSSWTMSQPEEWLFRQELPSSWAKNPPEEWLVRQELLAHVRGIHQILSRMTLPTVFTANCGIRGNWRQIIQFAE